GDGDTAVSLVGGVEVDVVGADAGRDGQLEVLGAGQALRGEVAGVEAVSYMRRQHTPSRLAPGCGPGPSGERDRAGMIRRGKVNLRSGDDDLGVNKLLVERG